MLTVTGTKFTATYVFTDLAVSQGVPDTVMTGGGERMMSWQASSDSYLLCCASLCWL